MSNVRTLRSILDQFQKEVEQFVDGEIPPKGHMVLTPAQLKELQGVLGYIRSASDLVNKIKNTHKVFVQGEEFQLTAEQMKRIEEQAFFHVKAGEPRTLAEATKEEAEDIVQRYLKGQLDYYMNQMVGTI